MLTKGKRRGSYLTRKIVTAQISEGNERNGDFRVAYTRELDMPTHT